jgi:Lar family restriction alleviation protein
MTTYRDSGFEQHDGLAPCPFCGGVILRFNFTMRHDSIDEVFVECGVCGARGPAVPQRPNRENVLKILPYDPLLLQTTADVAPAWNRREVTADPSPEAQLRATWNRLDDHDNSLPTPVKRKMPRKRVRR